MATPPTGRIPLYRMIAIVASCLGLFTACGIGYHPSEPPPPEPPQSEISLSADALEFPPTVIGSVSAPQDLIVTNHGTLPVLFEGFVMGTAEFRIQKQTCNKPLPPGGQCTVTVVFKPVRTRPLLSTLWLRSRGSIFMKIPLDGSALDKASTPPAPSQTSNP
jgi:hypothetical protein